MGLVNLLLAPFSISVSEYWRELRAGNVGLVQVASTLPVAASARVTSTVPEDVPAL